ncbi:phage baseplate protein [Thomasclavelia ramosa]|uniref:phage baseplate protein n=1 Tax=Thomasclavelia ramosa TaxID=1547 RepID=UPI00233EEB5C|nr:hypothetical protein [Thomasclavelia ramosa]MDC2832569.1 hypothetical protein [Thomasclavelia ramosa]
MIFSTITQNNLNLTADTTEIPAQYSNNIQFKFIQDNERFSGYIPTIYIGVYDSAMIECSDVINAGGAVVVDGDGVFAISNEIMYRNGFLAVGVTLTNNDENVSLKPVIYRIQASVGGLSPLPPDEGEWQQVVKAFVETLFNNWSAENLDPIKAQLEELISTAQTQQEKITSQQTQIDNAIGNMGDYEIVQEDPVQIRFKKGDGTFGETVDLGDGLASKAMVNAGYYTYKGISYGGSASNNGIDVAEIDGAYSQVTTNGFQLFDASKLPTKSQGGATVTNNGDGSFAISGSGNLTSVFSSFYRATEIYDKLKVGKIYGKVEVDTFPRVLIGIFDKTGDFYNKKYMTLTKNITSFDITQDELNKIKSGELEFRGYILGEVNQPIKAGTIKPMLYQDGDGTWEQFTGGIASPNPEYPQEPKFVGDYNEDAQKYDIDFMTSGKNLFDFNYLKNNYVIRGTKTYTDNSITLTSTGDDCYDNSFSSNTNFRIPVLPNKQYTLMLRKTNNVAGVMYIFPYTKNNVMHKQAISTNISYTGNIAYTFTTPQDCYYVSFRVGINLSGNTCTFSDFMVLYGTHTWDDVTEFIPYQGFETTTVELNQPLRELPNGVKDTIENGVVTRRVGEITFNGSETWLKNAGSANNWLYHIAITHVNAKGLCDSLPHNEIDVINSDGSGINRVGFNFTQYEKVMYLNVGYYMEQAGLTNTVDNLKTWLQSNPITVWYELATPTTEQITLPTLPSWYPYTDAWVGTELQPSFVEWHIKTAGVNQNDLTVIKEDISQLQTETTQLNDDVTRLMGAFTSVTDLTKQLFLLMHRVGDIIFSTSDENPSTIYGGTWVAWGKGQVPVGVDTSDSDFNTVEKTGGEKEHTLTVGEMPSHKHDFGQQFATTSNLSGEYGYYMIAGTQTDVIKNTGGNQPHNNLQPYITCYMWKRTA